MIKIKFKDWMYMNVGIVLIACATFFFLVPNQFVTGGMTGLATILGSLEGTPLTTSEWLICLNVFMLIIGFIFLGKKTGIWTVYCSLGYSGLMIVFQNIIVVYDGVTLTQATMLGVGIESRKKIINRSLQLSLEFNSSP